MDLVLALTVYWPVWHSQCTRTRFTVLALCSDELAVHSRMAAALLVCRDKLRNLRADCCTAGRYCL